MLLSLMLNLWESGATAEESAVEIKTGTGGIDSTHGLRRQRLPFKPTGIVDRPRKDIEQRVAESREIAAEVFGKLDKEFSLGSSEARQTERVSLSEIDAEIGALLHKEMQAQDMQVILMLLAACVESNAI